MKSTALGLVAAFALASANAAVDVGVSISVGEPGFYGRLDIGNFPRPQVIYAQPMIIQPVRGVVYEPVYLHVPPGHYQDWRRHCHRYDACGRPVYFVQDRWYEEVYVPHYRKRHYGERDEHRGRGHGKGRGKGHDRDG